MANRTCYDQAWTPEFLDVFVLRENVLWPRALALVHAIYDDTEDWGL